MQLRRAASHFRYQVSGSLHFLQRVLFNFPSQYLYAIGLKEYLRLEVDASHIPIWYPANGTQEHTKAFPSYPYVTITLYGLTFQNSSGSRDRA